jgi:hypothetical protein
MVPSIHDVLLSSERHSLHIHLRTVARHRKAQSPVRIASIKQREARRRVSGRRPSTCHLVVAIHEALRYGRARRRLDLCLRAEVPLRIRKTRVDIALFCRSGDAVSGPQPAVAVEIKGNVGICRRGSVVEERGVVGGVCPASETDVITAIFDGRGVHLKLEVHVGFHVAFEKC